MRSRPIALAIIALILLLVVVRLIPRGHVMFPIWPRQADGWRTELVIQWVTTTDGGFVITDGNWRYCRPQFVLVETKPAPTVPAGLSATP